MNNDAVGFEKVRGILFDATGTLFETRESVGAVYARLAVRHGVDVPPSRVDDAFRRVVAAAPPRVFADCDAVEALECERQWWRTVVSDSFAAADSRVAFADFDGFFVELYAFYQTEDAWALRPGARDTLADLKRRDYRTGVVSNFDQRLPTILQALGVHEFLDVVMTPARCRVEKPDPRIFEAALELLQLPARAVVYVGDDPKKDLEAAERAGLRSIDVCALAGFRELDSQIERINRACAESVFAKAR